MSVTVIARDTVVALTYTLRNQKGEVVEIHDLPVSYVHGSGADLFPKIERALDGKTIGDVVTIELTPEESFGHPDPKLMFIDDIENAPGRVDHAHRHPHRKRPHYGRRQPPTGRPDRDVSGYGARHPPSDGRRNQPWPSAGRRTNAAVAAPFVRTTRHFISCPQRCRFRPVV